MEARELPNPSPDEMPASTRKPWLTPVVRHLAAGAAETGPSGGPDLDEQVS